MLIFFYKNVCFTHYSIILSSNKMFHIFYYNILGLFVSRETLYSILIKNKFYVSRET